MFERIDIWEGKSPFLKQGDTLPYMDYYRAEKKKSDSTVVIFPGGGYSYHASYEGEDYALYLNSLGIDAFVLYYRCAPSEHPAPLLDARQSIRYIRKNAKRFGIDPERIAVMGSSAGGHLAALVSTAGYEIPCETDTELSDVPAVPNLQILCYPVTNFESHNGSYNNLLGAEHTEEERLALTPNLLVDDTTPPAFIWHTFEDATVAIASTYDYVTRLKEHNIPTELHVYPFGGHGLGLASAVEGRELTHVQSWAGLLENWLKLYGYIEE
jgi:acetyl esterase/lipase